MRNAPNNSTDFLARSILMKDIEQQLSTLAQTRFDVRSAPIRLVTICCNSSIWNYAWQEVSEPHDFHSVGCRLSDIGEPVSLGLFLAASKETESMAIDRLHLLGRF